MKYSELKKIFCEHERAFHQKPLKAHIIFTEDSFEQNYSKESRTYVVSSDNKAFMSGMGGYSIFASCLDGTDRSIRLERYMTEEAGGKKGWKVEDCYLIENDNG